VATLVYFSKRLSGLTLLSTRAVEFCDTKAPFTRYNLLSNRLTTG